MYTALYREWRPQDFRQVVGQEHVTRTLRNALRTGRLAHAYLFAGPRGTGKTSIAKVLAKAVNCAAPRDGEPCNECALCLDITAGSCLDVLEIDAASNRGIEEMRELREKVRYAPVKGVRRVYIIDEVHMLTAEAFNALLKTLEEPPEHVLFLLATTEPDKLPATVLSRCQRFDLRRLGLEEITGRLREVCRREGREADEEALRYLARRADGALRDALSILDQCLAYAEGDLDREAVVAVVGSLSEEDLFVLGEAASAGDGAAVLGWLERILFEGKDLRQVVRDLTMHFRDLLLARVDPGLVEGERIAAQAARFPQERLLAALEFLAGAEARMRGSASPRLVLELALLRAAGLLGAADGGDLATRLDRLERRLEGTPQAVASSDPPAPLPPATAPPDGPATAWRRVMEQVGRQRPSLKAFLEKTEYCGMQEGRLLLRPDSPLGEARLGRPEERRLLGEAAESVFGHPVSLELLPRVPAEDLLSSARELAREFPGVVVEEIKGKEGGAAQ
ncbi:MAG: DNA polymerase III subunit gamma/tau [Thermaerobacter sp.]|nr:DNA polymerase III subunit gamma/tau [Thermaerobacter sp.]